MECLLRDVCRNREKPISAFVLILILMECLLREYYDNIVDKYEKSLNPYSNGMLT